MEVYLRPTLTAFKAFGPGTEGMTVVDAASGRTFGHKMFLGGIFAGEWAFSPCWGGSVWGR